MIKRHVIIVAGGKGERSGLNYPKQFYEIQNKPIISYTIEAFHNIQTIDNIIIVCHENFIDNMSNIIKENNYYKVKKVIPGGLTRQKSVYNGLKNIDNGNGNDDIILIHDAARPFVTKKSIMLSIENCQKHGATGLYVEVKDTITEIIDSMVTSVPERSKLFITQTPQTFRYNIIVKSHEKYMHEKPDLPATDDVSIVKFAGFQVIATPGEDCNFKVTTPLDLKIAESIINKK